jgi:hypothetical protein
MGTYALSCLLLFSWPPQWGSGVQGKFKLMAAQPCPAKSYAVVSGLGSRYFATREACEWYIKRHEEDCIPAVIRGIYSKDAEISSRCVGMMAKYVKVCNNCEGRGRCGQEEFHRPDGGCPHPSYDAVGLCSNCHGKGYLE